MASYDNISGHFKPNPKSMPVADEAFGKLSSNYLKGKVTKDGTNNFLNNKILV